MKHIIAYMLILTICILPCKAETENTKSGLADFIYENYEVTAISRKELSEAIIKPAISFETNGIIFSIEEALFDGHTIFTRCSAVPIDKHIMLMSDFGSPEDCIIPKSGLNPDGSDISFAQKALETGKQLRAISLAPLDSDATNGLYVYDYHADGSLTIYSAQNYAITQNSRSCELRVKTRDPEVGELHGDNLEFSLDNALAWECNSYHKENGLMGMDVLLEYHVGPLQSWLQIEVAANLNLTADIQQCLSDSVLKIYADNSSSEIPTLSGGGMYLDAAGNSVGNLIQGGTAVYYFELVPEFSIPEQIHLELFQIFGNNQTADKCTIVLDSE